MVEDFPLDDILDDEPEEFITGGEIVSEEAPEPYEEIVHIEKPIYRKGLWLINGELFRKYHSEWEWNDFLAWSAKHTPILLRLGKGVLDMEVQYWLWSDYTRWFRGKRA